METESEEKKTFIKRQKIEQRKTLLCRIKKNNQICTTLKPYKQTKNNLKLEEK
jgi:hypothetical protein